MPKKRKRRCAGKGSSYERDFCRLLTQWWKPGAKDVIFWRASQSGGRATFRGRKGKRAGFGHGDIVAVQPAGETLIDLITFEIKRGYATDHVAELLDKPKLASQQTLEAWFQQAMEASKNAGSFAWMVVQRRNQRDAIVFMPQELVEVLEEVGCFQTGMPRPWFSILVDLHLINKTKKKKKVKVTASRFVGHTIYATTLKNWLDCVSPTHIRKLSQIC